MVDRVTDTTPDALLEAAQLLHDFNLEYDEPSPPPQQLARRLAELARDDHLVVLLARDDGAEEKKTEEETAEDRTAHVAAATRVPPTPTTSDIRRPAPAPAPTPAPAVGVAVLRVQPSIWSNAGEAYLAELYVVPARRGRGHGRVLLTEGLRIAREQGADYAFLVTSEEDRLAQRLYEAAGFRRTEGEGGPAMWAYEREL